MFTNSNENSQIKNELEPIELSKNIYDALSIEDENLNDWKSVLNSFDKKLIEEAKKNKMEIIMSFKDGLVYNKDKKEYKASKDSNKVPNQ